MRNSANRGSIRAGSCVGMCAPVVPLAAFVGAVTGIPSRHNLERRFAYCAATHFGTVEAAIPPFAPTAVALVTAVRADAPFKPTHHTGELAEKATATIGGDTDRLAAAATFHVDPVQAFALALAQSALQLEALE